MHKANKFFFFLLSLLLATTIAALFLWFQETPTTVIPPTPSPTPPPVPEDVVFSKPVSESILDHFSATMPSKISIKIKLPFEQLKMQAEQSTPTLFKGAGFGPDQCTTVLGIKKCVGTRFQYQVHRSEIAIEAAENNKIKIAIPLTISGAGGLRGKVAQWLHLDAKNFRAKVEAYANIGVALNKDWCPKLSIQPSFRWLETAEVEIMSNVWVDISDAVEKEFRSQAQQMSKEFAKAIPCEDVRREIKQFWTSRSLSVDTMNEQRFINLLPMKLGYSGLQIQPESVNIYLMLTVKADMTANPVKGPTLEPPNMLAEKFKPGNIQLNVPFYYAYTALQKKLSLHLQDTYFYKELSTGVASSVLRQLEIYPSNESLVFAGLVSVHLPEASEDINGWLYWTMSPSLDQSGASIRLQSLKLTAPFDDDTWRRVALVLEQTLLPALSKSDLLNLEIPSVPSNNAITASLAKIQQGALMNIGKSSIRLTRVLPLANYLYVEGNYQSIAELDYLVTQ